MRMHAGVPPLPPVLIHRMQMVALCAYQHPCKIRISPIKLNLDNICCFLFFFSTCKGKHCIISLAELHHCPSLFWAFWGNRRKQIYFGLPRFNLCRWPFLLKHTFLYFNIVISKIVPIQFKLIFSFSTLWCVSAPLQVKDLTRFLDPSGLGVISFEDFHRGISAISNGGESTYILGAFFKVRLISWSFVKVAWSESKRNVSTRLLLCRIKARLASIRAPILIPLDSFFFFFSQSFLTWIGPVTPRHE